MGTAAEESTPAGMSDDRQSSRTSESLAGWSCQQIGSFPSLRPNRNRFSWLDIKSLLKSRNDILAGVFGDPCAEIREQWVAACMERSPEADFCITPDLGQSYSFLVLGDTGEGDASQYAVVPGMLKVGIDTAFAVIASDVIYPAGAGNEYDDKFFRPYEKYPAPIYAVPGNHDWYDSLHGFMRVFCDIPALPRQRRRFPRFSATLRDLLWTKPAAIDDEHLARARARRANPGQQALQPGPYWTIKLPDLTLVGLDTGISGVIDRPQGEWLRRVSAAPGPKILITGKPIYDRNRYRPCSIEGGGTVDQIVRTPAYSYLAAIGGDTHNYQRYPVQVDDRVIQYIVAGGGGAYTHATHTIPRISVGGVHEDDFRCYPLRGDSLSFFSKLYSDRLHLPGLYLSPDEGLLVSSQWIGNTPPRAPAGDSAAPGTITPRMRWAARLLGAWPMPLRLPVGRVYQRYLSEVSDWDAPPFFKSFLHLSVETGTLCIRCYAATGCAAHEKAPPLEDEVKISLR